MSLLDETIVRITPRDARPAEKAAALLAERMEGDDAALGAWRDLLLRYIRITGDLHPAAPSPCVVIACADHGVAAESVSAYPPETTVQMARNYLVSRGGAANAFAALAGAGLVVVDMGMKVKADLPGLLDCRIACGTKDMAKEPAMTRAQATASIEAGIALAQKLIAAGCTCLLPGEMGIANTTASAAICAAICGLSADAATGRGTNISNARLAAKIAVVRRALEHNAPDPADGIDVLAKVGGFEFGCIAGLILGAAAEGAAVILDGANCAAAALIAQSIAPASTNVLIASHRGGEQSHRHSLEKPGLPTYMKLGLCLGEAGGSSIICRIIEILLRTWEVLDTPHESRAETRFSHTYMPKDDPTLTDKTFDFYLHTMQELDGASMRACQSYIDNLAKPIYSLGALEPIAVELAGIIGEERPAAGQETALLCFSARRLYAVQEALTQGAADAAGVTVEIAHLKQGASPRAAFHFGRERGEALSVSYPILALAASEQSADVPLGTMAGELSAALLTADGALRYDADDFLRHVPPPYQGVISALMGAIIAAAHNCSLLVLDDAVTDIVARYAERLCPAVRPYLLHARGTLLRAKETIPGGFSACIATTLVEASLMMLNKMKTFADAKVSVAADGPGAGKQHETK